MKTIFKYPLAMLDTQLVTLPEGAKVLTVQSQHGQPMLWAEVDTYAPGMVNVKVTMGTTGNPLPDLSNARYVGSFQIHEGRFVGHIYVEGA